MKIFFADKFPPSHVAALEARGHTCVVAPATLAEELPALLGGVDVLVVRSTRVTETALDAADRLALIVRAGAGVNTIDWRAAADRGVYVANTPGKNAVAVAELTIGLLAALDRRIPDAVADLRAGRWRKSDYAKAQGLARRRLAVIGTGAIGLEVAARARALEMEVVVEEKPHRAAATVAKLRDLGCVFADRATMLSTADAVTVHVPASPETEGMVDTAFLTQMKDGAFLINTSRGDVVDEEALLAALDAKGIRAGLDVFRDEPGEGTATFDSRLAQHPHVYGTHHIGASTEQAQEAIAAEVVEIVRGFELGVVRNCVNLAEGESGTTTIAVRHHNRIGVLARVLGILGRAHLNVEQMANQIFAGGAAAIATIHVTGDLDDAVAASIAADDDVIGVSVAGG